MTVEEKRCKKCGQINIKSVIYCVNCGAILDKPELFPIEQGITNDVSKIGQGKKNASLIDRYKQLNLGLKVALYFGIVVLVNLVVSLILVLSLGLPIESYFLLFLGLFILIMIIVGVIGNITVFSDFTAHLAKAIGQLIVAIIIILIIVVPIYAVFALPSIIGSFSVTMSLPPAVEAAIEAINDAIGNAIANIFNALVIKPIEGVGRSIGENFESAFESVEVPGFEPFLLITIFVIASIFIIYRYHLIARKPLNI